MPQCVYVTPLFCMFHWLSLWFQLWFKVLAMTYKAIHGMGIGYPRDCLSPVVSAWQVPSAKVCLFPVPLTKQWHLSEPTQCLHCSFWKEVLLRSTCSHPDVVPDGFQNLAVLPDPELWWLGLLVGCVACIDVIRQICHLVLHLFLFCIAFYLDHLMSHSESIWSQPAPKVNQINQRKKEKIEGYGRHLLCLNYFNKKGLFWRGAAPPL